MFVNAEWNGLFLDASIQHLKRAYSDHCPVSLSLERNQDIRLPRPFRFQLMWLTHPEFSAIVREAWSSPTTLCTATSKFADKAKVWNKNIFGNLFHRKKKMLARLQGIQTALSINPNDFLVDLEINLRAKFQEVSKLEEEFWAMKSRIPGWWKGIRI